MKNLQVRQAKALQRTVDFLQAPDTASHLKDLPAAYRVQVEKLALAEQRVAALGERQSLGTDAITAESKTGKYLREKLRGDYLIPVGRVCRPHFKKDPGARVAFLVPHANKKSPVLVAAARAMHKVLSAHVDVLVEEGFSAKTLEEIEALTDELEEIAGKAQLARDERSGITRDLAQAIAQAFERLGAVEGFLMTRFKTDQWLRARWKNMRKVPGHVGYNWNWSRHASPGRKGLIKPRRKR